MKFERCVLVALLASSSLGFADEAMRFRQLKCEPLDPASRIESVRIFEGTHYPQVGGKPGGAQVLFKNDYLTSRDSATPYKTRNFTFYVENSISIEASPDGQQFLWATVNPYPRTEGSVAVHLDLSGLPAGTTSFGGTVLASLDLKTVRPEDKGLGSIDEAVTCREVDQLLQDGTMSQDPPRDPRGGSN